MRWRILVLPIAAGLISLMVWHKLSQLHSRSNVRAIEQATFGHAPGFEALDKDNSITRLKTYQGRHDLLVVFFDGEQGAASDEVLQHLKRHSADLAKADFHVIAVSSALPQQNRLTDFPSRFHLLTDPPPIWKIHREWGCFDEQNDLPVQAVFHIDRAGNVLIERGMPVPMNNSDRQIDVLLGAFHGSSIN
ncbi:MAG: redoxin domain-containing protein [Planctomycetota bacterium]|nr:redoxin domain-containing protein [Planctomycetota bacterium]